MTKGELITILELYKIGRWNLEGVLTAIDRYSSALIAAKPNVSGSFCDCTGNETYKYYDDSGVKKCWECRKEAK